MEHAALQVLLRTGDIRQLCAAERALVPQRSLHKLARAALNSITEAGPDSPMDRNLEPWFPWRSYVAYHKTLMMSSDQELLWPGQSSWIAPVMVTEEDRIA